MPSTAQDLSVPFLSEDYQRETRPYSDQDVDAIVNNLTDRDY